MSIPIAFNVTHLIIMLRICLCLFIFLATINTGATQSCKLNRTLGKVRIINAQQIYDGDTLKTQKAEKIRLIGINTPEMHPKNKREPLAKAALHALKKWQNHELLLQLDRQTKDRYGRTLGHLFDMNGQSINAQLLEKGLGFLVSIPPNTHYQNCYLAASKRARQANTGVYAHSYFTAKSTKSKHLQAGFGRFIGKIKSVHVSKKIIWLNFKGHISIKIKPENLSYIDGELYQSILKAKRENRLNKLADIEFSGWLIDRMRFGSSMVRKIKTGKRARFMLELSHKNQWHRSK